MALSNYTELQAAVRTEVSVTTSGLSADAITDAINRAEAKINRRTRCIQQQTLATETMTSASRFVDAPTGFVEWITVRVKKSSEPITNYFDAIYVAPEDIARFYGRQVVNRFHFTVRQQFEFAEAVTENHTVQFDYIKAWDIATETTNWLLTNYPDVYLYGALVECEAHLKNDSRILLWKSLFDEATQELNNLEDRIRDDAQLDTSEAAAMASRSSFNVLTGDY